MPDLLVNIDVDDLEKAIRFYTLAFGLHVGRRFGAEAVEILGAPSAIYLLAKRQGTGAWPGGTAVRDYRRHWSPIHLDFVVNNLEAAVTRAKEAGAVLEEPIGEHKWGRMAMMADPFGHGFCFVTFRGRGYDELGGGVE
jgi:predicted enzyme related to lactoylglutathione lyase